MDRTTDAELVARIRVLIVDEEAPERHFSESQARRNYGAVDAQASAF